MNLIAIATQIAILIAVAFDYNRYFFFFFSSSSNCSFLIAAISLCVHERKHAQLARALYLRWQVCALKRGRANSAQFRTKNNLNRLHFVCYPTTTSKLTRVWCCATQTPWTNSHLFSCVHLETILRVREREESILWLTNFWLNLSPLLTFYFYFLHSLNSFTTLTQITADSIEINSTKLNISLNLT